MKKNKSQLILKADRPVYGGLSIGRHEGKVVMIKGSVLPGETIEVNIEKEKKDYSIAAVTRIIKPSPDRIEPACPYFGTCGGCHLQYIFYEKQVKIKEDILRDCLKRLAKIDIDLSESILSESQWNYRFRGQFKISRGRIGFYRERTREVIDIDNCPLMIKEVNEYLKKAKALLTKVDAGEIHISCGDRCTALLEVTAHSAGSGADRDRLGKIFLDSGFSGIFIGIKDKKVLRYGEHYITLNLEDLQYTISPKSFFQSNWELNKAVAAFIKENLLPLKGKKVLDLYSGAGNFSLQLASDADKVIAVEENPCAIEDGRRNLKINNIKNCKFIRSSAENFHMMDNIYIVMLDPPRQGLSSETVNKMLKIMPERIVYISCNPATFARDLKKLLEKYSIESIRMIDFFPQTFHIEALAFLKIKGFKGPTGQ